MAQRTIKIKINCSEEQKGILYTTLRQFTDAFNRACSVGWEQPRVNGVELHNLTYKDERNISDLPSQLVCSSRVKATEALKSAKTLAKKKRKVSCPKSALCPIRYDARSSSIKLNASKASLASIKGRQHVTFQIAPYYKKYLHWDIGSADLCTGKKGQLFLHVVVKSSDPQFVSSGETIGIDLGINRPAVTSDNIFLGERHWREVENRVFRLRRKLQAKGTKSAKRQLGKIGRRTNRFREDCDHVLSKCIVGSVKPGATIVLEDLTDLRTRTRVRKKQRRRHHGWSFARLKVFVGYKAAAKGVSVAYVDPRYTSQKCSKCGHISRANRKSQSEFKCKRCKFSLNADLNASRNIRSNHLASIAMSETGGLPVNQPIVGACSHVTHKPPDLSVGS